MANWEIINDDVMNWAKNYKGEPFMALFCDPPYHLHDGKGRGGFMQREWNGTHDISFKPETWKALAQHLLPGAFVLAFASSRGWHRLACALEDAGMVMQPSIFVNGLEMDIPFCLSWACGSSFPKATNISTQIDKAAGKLEERETRRKVYGDGKEYHPTPNRTNPNPMDWETKGQDRFIESLPATPLARAWQGHRYGGQVLRDALTPIIVCQKPWTGKRLDCIVETGAGAINVDGGRIGLQGKQEHWDDYQPSAKIGYGGDSDGKRDTPAYNPKGRWPQNLVLVHTKFCLREGVQKVKNVSGSKSGNEPSQTGGEDTVCYGEYGRVPFEKYGDANGLETVATWRCLIACPECGYTWLAVDKEVCPKCKTLGEWQCAVRRLGEQSGEKPTSRGFVARGTSNKWSGIYNNGKIERGDEGYYAYGDTGTAARFFHQSDWSYEVAEQLATTDPVHYCPKSSTRERESGLFGIMPCVKCGKLNSRTHVDDKGREVQCRRNSHETVKPISLNRHLATLLLPPPEYAPRRTLIPFFGVGSEGIGALLAGFEEIVGVEMDAEYCEIGEARMKYWASRPEQMKLF